MAVEIVPCYDWGAIPRKTGQLPVNAPRGIIIHHTATANVLPYKTPSRERLRSYNLAQSIQRSHLQRHWTDTGQHFTVARGGLVLEGRHGSLLQAQRGLVIRGAHAGKNEGNLYYWGIEVEGTYTKTLPTPDQLQSLVQLCAWLCLIGNVDSANIKGHREFRATQCPGDALFAYLGELRKAVHEEKLKLMQQS